MAQFSTETQIGECANLDIKCICSDTEFLNNMACCLAESCDLADQSAAVLYAQQICSTVGVRVPSQVACSSASASATSSAEASVLDDSRRAFTQKVEL